MKAHKRCHPMLPAEELDPRWASRSKPSHGDRQLDSGGQHVAVALLHAPAAEQRRRGAAAGTACNCGQGEAEPAQLHCRCLEPAGLLVQEPIAPPAHAQKEVQKTNTTARSTGALDSCCSRHLSKWNTPWPVPTRLSSHTYVPCSRIARA